MALAAFSVLSLAHERYARRRAAGSAESPPFAASSRRLVLAALLVPALLFAFLAWQDRVRIMRHVRKDAMHTVAIFYQHARNVFAIHALAAALVDEKIRRMGWDEIAHSATPQRDLVAIASRYPQIASLSLVDPNGIVRNSSSVLPAAPINVATRDSFQALRARDLGIFVSRPVAGRIFGHRHFDLALRRTGASNAFDGIIVVSVRSACFTDFWKKTAPHLDVAVKLLRGDGTLLAGEPLPDAEAKLAPNNPLLLAIDKSDAGSITAVSGGDGIRRFYGYQKIDFYPVYLAYGVGLEAVQRRWHRHLVVFGSLSGSAALVLTLMALAFTRSAHREAMALQRGRVTDCG
jgi:hypothetical protein